MHKELLEDIGEKELIKRLAEFMPKNQVSDDCACLLYTSPSPRDATLSRMPSSA